MLVSCLGDIMLDVIVDAPGGLVPDDDTPARITFSAGGQAANVGAWVNALGGRSRVYGPRSEAGNGRLVAEALTTAGIEVHGPFVEHQGAVMSLVVDGHRSMASDAPSTEWLAQVGPGPWLEGADWLFVSGYALFRTPRPERLVELAGFAHGAGIRVAVDLASAAMIQEYDAAMFRRLWQALRPEVVFANDLEWTATQQGHSPLHVSSTGSGGSSVLALKHGPEGCTFVIDGIGDYRSPLPGTVRDTTGAGDALAAGFLVGGIDLAMDAAARCVGRVGAHPRVASDGSEAGSP